MNATVETAQTAQTALPLAQVSLPRPDAEVLELFPGSSGRKPVRLPTRLHSNVETGPARPSDDSAGPKRSKMRLMGSELGMATAEYANVESSYRMMIAAYFSPVSS